LEEETHEQAIWIEQELTAHLSYYAAQLTLTGKPIMTVMEK
jgi:hypothetical protein